MWATYRPSTAVWVLCIGKVNVARMVDFSWYRFTNGKSCLTGFVFHWPYDMRYNSEVFSIVTSHLCGVCPCCTVQQCPIFLLQVKNMQVRLPGDSKVAIDVNVNIRGCLCLCVSPATGAMCRGYTLRLTLWQLAYTPAAPQN